MKPEAILQSDILDILFEGRNKDYGAYVLRKTYSKHLMYAIGIMVVAVTMLIAFNFFYKKPFKPNISASGPFISDTVVLTPIEPPNEPVPPKVRSAKSAIEFVKPFITRDEMADTIAEAQELLNDNVQIGLVTTLDSGTDIGIHGPVELLAEPAPAPAIEKTPEIFKHVEQMPEFPGGNSALYRFLSRNLRVPDGELQPGETVRVVVKFVVNAGGEITGIRFAESIEKAFEGEVWRVMKKMPKWKPGIQNGRAVAVYYNIQVVFEAPDE
jgi:protein TonB